MGSDSEEDVPLMQRVKPEAPPGAQKADSDDEDMPLVRRISQSARRSTGSGESSAAGASRPASRPASRATSAASATTNGDDDDFDDDAPLLQRALEARVKRETSSEAASVASGAKRRRSSASDARPRKSAKGAKAAAPTKPKPKPKPEPKSPRGRAASNDADEAASESEYKWWRDLDNMDATVKWQTLEHNGVYFPPPYQPHGVPLVYDGRPITLPPAAEEVAGFFAQVIGTEWAENEIFQRNFFRDFSEVLAKTAGAPKVAEFAKCDFSRMHEHFQRQKEARKAMTKEEKLQLKADNLAIEEKYGWALMDGRREKVGNFRIEIPGLFRGRGSHPKTGCLKLRVLPEQITLNIGRDAPVPRAPEGHQWGSVVHDNKVTWLAMWRENVNESTKYVFLGATSALKGLSDLKKFEKARALKGHVDRIRADYVRELRDSSMATRQRATAMYLIDRLALRAGNEKGEDEADTVGCCSLRFEHITLEPPNRVIFDFLGKDSIRYYNEVEVDEQVFKNLRLFKREPKVEGDLLFDRLSTQTLNKHLSTYMDGLTAKVFRTYNASFTFQNELRRTQGDTSVAEKLLAYNRANRQVAILCNHQRSVPKGHGSQMSRMDDKLKALRYQRRQCAEQLLQLDPKLRKRRPELSAPEDDLDDAFVTAYEQILAEKEVEKRRRDLERTNAKRAEQGEKPLRLEDLPPPRKTAPSLERLEKQHASLTDRIKAMQLMMVDKDENKTTALGTSKINYIDPRLSAAWCKRYSVPLEKIFNKSLREKFKWAMDVEGDWVF